MYVRHPFNGKSVEDLNLYVQNELLKLEGIFKEFVIDSVQFTRHNTEPNRPGKGHIFYADGTNWNPGYGEGPYVWLGDEWSPLFLVSGIWRPAHSISSKTLKLVGKAPKFTNTGQLFSPASKSLTLTPIAPSWSRGITVDPWNIATASYDGVSLVLTALGAFRTHVFSPDGTNLYTTESTNDSVHRYTLSTAWDLSTASFISTYDASTETNTPVGIEFKTDGTKMYILDASGTESIYQYSLSSAWDISTASYDSVSKDVESDIGGATSGFRFKSDGTKFYISSTLSDSVYQYSLSSAWDISTASYDSLSKDVSAQAAQPDGMYFKSDGATMFLVNQGTSTVYQYTLSTPWKIDTASYDSISFDASGDALIATQVWFKSDGTKMYIGANGNRKIFQYSL